MPVLDNNEYFRGYLVEELENDPGQKLEWPPADKKILWAHAARYQMTTKQMVQHGSEELARELGIIDRPFGYRNVILTRAQTHLRALVTDTLQKRGILIRTETREQHTNRHLVIWKWPAYTIEWLRPDWDGHYYVPEGHDPRATRPDPAGVRAAAPPGRRIILRRRQQDPQGRGGNDHGALQALEQRLDAHDEQVGGLFALFDMALDYLEREQRQPQRGVLAVHAAEVPSPILPPSTFQGTFNFPPTSFTPHTPSESIDGNSSKDETSDRASIIHPEPDSKHHAHQALMYLTAEKMGRFDEMAARLMGDLNGANSHHQGAELAAARRLQASKYAMDALAWERDSSTAIESPIHLWPLLLGCNDFN